MRDSSDNSRLQYSLRGLLTAVVVVALLGLSFRFAWHVALLMTAIVIAVAATVVALRVVKNQSSRFQCVTACLIAVATWLFLYAVSIGPVYLAFGTFPNERPERFLSVVYAPVLWLECETLLREPIYEYTRAWGSYRTVISGGVSKAALSRSQVKSRPKLSCSYNASHIQLRIGFRRRLVTLRCE